MLYLFNVVSEAWTKEIIVMQMQMLVFLYLHLIIGPNTYQCEIIFECHIMHMLHLSLVPAHIITIKKAY